jgi:arylsulfatase A-like enzyme
MVDEPRRWVPLWSCIIALAACSPEEPPWQPPDMLLISIDTLRADHLPTYGYPRPTAPRIDELARQSAIFDEAYTEAPFTLPAHTSLLTGLYPDRHGVHDRGDTLGPDVVTLAQLLEESGYQTAAFTNSYFVSAEFGIDRGFDVFDSAHEISVKRNAEQTNQAILSWLDTASDEPVFVFAHYYDVHSDWERLPYDSPPAFRKRFAGTEPEGFRAGNGVKFASRYMALLNQEGTRYSDDERRYVEGLYDAGIAYADEQLGALLDALRERRRLDRMIVVLTADHGEEFQEHGRLLHTQIFQELVRIPLLVSLPEMRGAEHPTCRPGTAASRFDSARFRAGRSAARSQLVDLLPTLAECVGIAVPVAAQGQSLLPALAGEAPESRTVFLDYRRTEAWGVLRDDWKLAVSEKRKSKRLYHLASDPGELRDMALEWPEVVGELESELASHRATNAQHRSEGVDREVPDEVHEALEALGYARGEDDSAP